MRWLAESLTCKGQLARKDNVKSKIQIRTKIKSLITLKLFITYKTSDISWMLKNTWNSRVRLLASWLFMF